MQAARVLTDDPEDLPRWWPSVYLDVRQIERGDPSGVGSSYELLTRGWLPYTLRWSFRVTEVEPDKRAVIEAWGHLVGRGEWTFEQDGEYAVITYDWKIRAEKPLLTRLSWLLKPVFTANHRWAMNQGLELLKAELSSSQLRLEPSNKSEAQDS